LRVPEDFSVLGFDDVLPAEVATPGITTIRQPLKEMGLQAAKWMLEALERKVDRAPRLYEASPELVVRTSSARPARQKGKSKKLLQNRT
jgi:LacI family transcriptional regulator